jgi:hypothetical protein
MLHLFLSGMLHRRSYWSKRYTNLEYDQLDANMKKRVVKGKKRDVRDMDYYNAIEQKELGYMLPTESC